MDPSFNWRDMLRFDKMIAPTFLTVLYYIHTTASILTSLWFVQKGLGTSYGGGAMVMLGLLGLVVGPFVVRLLYELLIVIFKIHTRLSSIDYTLRGQPIMERLPSDSPQPSPVSSPASPYNQPDSPSPVSYPASEPPPLARLAPNPVVQQPAGFQVSATEAPLPDASPVMGGAMPDFWKTDTPPLPPRTSISPVRLDSVLQNVPNWPAVLAALLVLYAVLSPYAVIGYASTSLGQLAGLTYAIKSSSLGILVVLSALVMLITSAGGLQWRWFMVSYGVTILGSVIAFMDESSVFSQLSKAKAAMGTVGSTLDGFIPQANQFSQQMAQNVPDASQFLTLAFYLLILAMLFLGYWALAGKYQERGLLTNGSH